MRFSELQSVCAETVASGRLGSLVAVRMSLQLSATDNDLPAVCGALIDAISEWFSASPDKIIARLSHADAQFNGLISFAAGQSLSLSVGQGSAANDRIDLLLIGNHGISRLEGGEIFVADQLPQSKSAERWRDRIADSMRSHSAVTI